jgi:putative membrane protein
MQNKGTLGAALGLLAAVCYGFIPLLTKPLQTPEAGSLPMSSSTILFYRFGLAALVVAGVMLMRRISFRISYPEFVRLTFLAFLSDGAALFLIAGYPYMNSGVATTIHFMYPVMTALMMMTFFHERRRISTFLAVGMAVLGVGLLSWSDSGAVAPIGIVLELISALCFAFYLIRVNHSRVSTINVVKLTFYVMALGAIIFAAFVSYEQADFDLSQRYTLLPNNAQGWMHLAGLALICTVDTNLSLIYATHLVGPTMASVLGALEPVTAILVGACLLGESLTLTILLGIAVILAAVLIIILKNRRPPSCT